MPPETDRRSPPNPAAAIRPTSALGAPLLLVSVRSTDEASSALEGGADIIDVKEPLAGPLAKELFTAFQTVTFFVLIFAGRLRLPVIGRGHIFSLVLSCDSGSCGRATKPSRTGYIQTLEKNISQ